jgi:hypothetical protein
MQAEGLFFDPEGGGDMFFPNVSRLSMEYMALYLHNNCYRKLMSL